MVSVNRFIDNVLPSYFRESEFGQNGNKYLEFRWQPFNQTEGLQSKIYKGNVYFQDNNGNLKQSKSLIIKTTLTEVKRTILCLLTDMSLAYELLVYNTILPFFYEMNHSLANLFPKFYYGASIFGNTFKGFQILENLQEEGYHQAESKTFLDITHLSLMLKKLGVFHAYSYQAKKHQPKTFFEMIDNIKETMPTFNHEKNIFTPLHEYYLDRLTSFEKYRNKVEVIKNTIQNPLQFMEKIRSIRKEPTAVLCHGDFHRSNVLFKYDSENNPVDIKFIDLGNTKYCSPTVDLGVLLYMNSDQDTRDQYWDQLIDTYYDALKNTFPENDLVPTKNDILEEFKVTILGPYLFVMVFLPLIITWEEHSAPDWFTRYFEPEHAEYKSFGFQVPCHVLQKAFLNLVTPSKANRVLDVLFDIINRGFV